MTIKEYPFEFPAGQHQNCQTLTELTVEHLPRDASLGRLRRYRKGADVWHPEDRQDGLYFLRQGEVAIVAGDAEGREVVIRTIGVGKPFGELCFCGKYKFRGTIARAVVASEAVEVKLADFTNYMLTNGEVLAAFVCTFCIRLADAERRIEILAQRGAEDRLGRLLIHLAAARREANAPQSSEVALPVSHDELAQMAAMSRPHVTLTLNKFRRRGLVRYERNRPLVVNVPSLEAYLTGE